ncbi:uncharacterized protein LOC110729078 [Chenopodium quinoa]|uniref:uncharacterized protein LOC110729078 n=1 Tax=Chenopodium quinoa TaxID=63459 RepID=UPI000B7746E5|nr:uncharacterized protein LOC110729078 [Chenopodium quinoa]
MNWYRRITRTIITPPTQIRPSTHYQPASTELVLSHALGDIAQRCMRIIEAVGDLPMEKALPLTLESFRTINAYCADTLTRVDQPHLLQDSEVLRSPSASTPSSSSLQSVLHSQAPRKRKQRDLRGRGRGPSCQLSTSFSPSVSSPALTTTPMLSSSTLTTSTPLPSFTPRPPLLAATSSPSFTSMLPHNYSGISTYQVASSIVVSPPLVYARRTTFTTSPILEVDESNFETP